MSCTTASAGTSGSAAVAVTAARVRPRAAIAPRCNTKSLRDEIGTNSESGGAGRGRWNRHETKRLRLQAYGPDRRPNIPLRPARTRCRAALSLTIYLWSHELQKIYIFVFSAERSLLRYVITRIERRVGGVDFRW